MVAAARKDLTDKAVKALKPALAGKRYIVWDAQLPHFGVRVTDRADEEGKAAVRTFVVVKRVPGQRDPVTHVIGRYPATPLKDARDLARGVLGVISEGKSPREVEREQRREDARRRGETFAAALTAFLEDGALAGLRSGGETEAILRRDFLGQISKRVKKTSERDGKPITEWVTEWSGGPDSAWSKLPVAKIERRDVIERLDTIKRRRGKHAARHALGAARKFYSWCAEGERFGIVVSPCANIRDKTIGFSKDGRELKRRRVLADAELRDVWAAADHLTAQQREKALAKNAEADVSRMFDPVEPLVKLLALTGQRLNDIACARRPEIDLEKATLLIPPERYKTNTAQEVPLPPLAVDILKALPRFARGFALTTTGGARPVSGVSKMKARLDKAIAARRKKAGTEPMPSWVLHDLRRTVRTRLVSDLGVEAFVAERVIGHALPGLHGVYDQGTHRDQKRDALERWAKALAVIVGLKPPPEGATVVTAQEVEKRRKRKRS
jgi:integrase